MQNAFCMAPFATQQRPHFSSRRRANRNLIPPAMSSPLTRLFRLRSPVAILAICFIGLITIPSLYLLNSKSNFSLKQQEQQQQQRAAGGSYERTPNNPILVDPTLNDGGVIMPKLGNATAKYALLMVQYLLQRGTLSTAEERSDGRLITVCTHQLRPCVGSLGLSWDEPPGSCCTQWPQDTQRNQRVTNVQQ